MSFATQGKLNRMAFCPRTLARKYYDDVYNHQENPLHFFPSFLQFYYTCLNKAAQRMFAGLFYILLDMVMCLVV